MKSASTRVIEALSQRGYRVTGARQAIITILGEQTTPVSIQTLVEAVAADEASVYRTINLLTKEGLVEEIPVRGGKAQYALAHHHHHHIVCRTCHKVAHVGCVGAPEAPAVADFPVIDEHEVTYYGLCKTCA